MSETDPTGIETPAHVSDGAAATGAVRTVAVVDVDGVLADVRHRLHHLERRPKDWDSFFAAAPADPPLAEGFAVLRHLADSHDVVYLSGRPERLRRATEHWLAEHGAPPGSVVLRRDGDRRPARQLKVGELLRIGRTAPVAVLVDDDEAVCAAAKAAGFVVFQASWAVQDGAGDTASNRTLHAAQEHEGRT